MCVPVALIGACRQSRWSLVAKGEKESQKLPIFKSKLRLLTSIIWIYLLFCLNSKNISCLKNLNSTPVERHASQN